MSIKDKLARFRPQLVGEEARPTASAPCDAQPTVQTSGGTPPPTAASLTACGAKSAPLQIRDIAYREKWGQLQASPAVFDDAYVMVREVRYPPSHTHGKYTFAQFRDTLSLWTELGLDHPLSGAGTTPEEWLFFDTETTGLNGGTGNTIFLLGYCRVEADAVVVRQHFLPSPAAEAALYQSFIQDISEAKRLVTFNGKSFDWPQVKTRHTLLRSAAPRLPSFIHHDLVHGARRLWKNDLPSCRLSVVESAKLGVDRHGDTPGHMAPLLYFEHLRTGNPDVIEGVLRHNEMDVLSLITLYIHLSDLILRFPGDAAASAEERLQMARWHDALGQTDLAIAGYRTVAQSAHPLRLAAKLSLGDACKRRKDWNTALEVWEQCAAELAYVPENLYIELAKLCEHHLQDYEKALHYAREACAAWSQKAGILRRRPQQELTSHKRRLARLERKLGQQ